MLPAPPLPLPPPLAVPWEPPELPPGRAAPPVPGFELLLLPDPPRVVAGELRVGAGFVAVLDVGEVVVVFVGEVLVVTVLVVGVVFVVVCLQSWRASAATVLAPCLRLLVRVGLTPRGRLSTAFVNESTALVAVSHCPEPMAAEA